MKYTRIVSKIESIEKLALYPLPTRPVKADRAVRYDRAFVVIGTDGKIYTSQVNTHVYWTRVNRVQDTVRCLIKLGMLSKAALDEHFAAEEAENEVRKKRYAREAILEYAKDAGIKLTAAQQRKLSEGSA